MSSVAFEGFSESELSFSYVRISLNILQSENCMKKLLDLFILHCNILADFFRFHRGKNTAETGNENSSENRRERGREICVKIR